MRWKAPGNYSASIWYNNFRFAYGRAPKPSFLWFRICWTRPRAPKPILFIFWDTKIPNKNQEKSWAIFKKYYVYKSRNFGNPKLWQFSKRRAPKHPDDPSDKILRILDMTSKSVKNGNLEIWNKHLLKTWTGNLVRWESVFLDNI